MIENQQHQLAAESQFASGCLCNTAFAKDFSEIWKPELSVVKALDWLVPFSRDYVKKYSDAPGLDALPYVEAAIRSCDLPEEAMGFFRKLEPTLREGLPQEKLVALRQCIERVWVNRPDATVKVLFRSVPVGRLGATETREVRVLAGASKT